MFHRIHLKGPWEWERHTPGGSRDLGKVTMPARWSELMGDLPGTICLRRWFHSPTNIEHDDVMIIVPALVGAGRILLNDALLGVFELSNPDTVEYSLRNRLQTRNRLMIEVTWTPVESIAGGLPEPVYLEMRPL